MKSQAVIRFLKWKNIVWYGNAWFPILSIWTVTKRDFALPDPKYPAFINASVSFCTITKMLYVFPLSICIRCLSQERRSWMQGKDKQKYSRALIKLFSWALKMTFADVRFTYKPFLGIRMCFFFYMNFYSADLWRMFLTKNALMD